MPILINRHRQSFDITGNVGWGNFENREAATTAPPAQWFRFFATFSISGFLENSDFRFFSFDPLSLTCGRSQVQVLYRPPYMRNPNFRPVGQGFGFLVYITDIVIRDI